MSLVDTKQIEDTDTADGATHSAAPAEQPRKELTIADLDEATFGNFKDVARQAMQATPQTTRRKSRSSTRKGTPGYNSGAYPQLKYESYKQFHSGQHNITQTLRSADEPGNYAFNNDATPELSKSFPNTRSSCDFLSKTAAERSARNRRCEHQSLIKIVALSACAFAILTWSLIIFSACVKAPAPRPVAASPLNLTEAPPVALYNNQQSAEYNVAPDATAYAADESTAQGQTQPTDVNMQTLGGRLKATSAQRQQDAAHASTTLLSHMFTWLAFGLLCLGATVFCFTWGIFSPSGSLNISEKNKYIPSPFRAEHDRLLSQLNKPLLAGGVPLGQRTEWKPWFPWRPKLIALTPSMRAAEPHTLIVGQRRTGKSRLVAGMIKHDIESRDRTVVVIDTKGDLVDSISDWLFYKDHKGEITSQIITIDPESSEQSIRFNPLQLPADDDWLSVSTAIVNGFKAIYSEPPGAKASWSAQTANILRNAALLLLANGKMLSDLPRLLNDNDYRDSLLDTVEKRREERPEYSTLLTTWSQYKKLARTDEWINWVEPILNRITPLLSDVRLRDMLNSQNNNIDLIKSINEKSIILVRLPRGTFGQSANLIGSLIVTAIRRNAMSQYEDSTCKNDIALYVDEFDNIVDKDTLELLSLEKTKLRIGLTAVCKTLQNFPEDFRNTLIVSFANIACFALAKKDADIMGPQMFRVDGRKIKHRTVTQFFNRANSTPQFELVSDEEKLNMDRIVGQNVHQFFFYIVSSKAGVFSLKTHDWLQAQSAVGNSSQSSTMESIKTICQNILEIVRHKIARALLA